MAFYAHVGSFTKGQKMNCDARTALVLFKRPCSNGNHVKLILSFLFVYSPFCTAVESSSFCLGPEKSGSWPTSSRVDPPSVRDHFRHLLEGTFVGRLKYASAADNRGRGRGMVGDRGEVEINEELL